MNPADGFWTRDMVLAFPEGGDRYDTVSGELLVTLPPTLRHQLVLKRLLVELELYSRRQPVGEVLASPADISWGPDILVQPDLFVIAREQAGARDWSEVTKLELAVEVLSPASARADRFTKRRLYQAQGVGTYWVVDADAGTLEVWTPEATFPVNERELVTWRPTGASAPLEIELAGLCRDVRDASVPMQIMPAGRRPIQPYQDSHQCRARSRHVAQLRGSASNPNRSSRRSSLKRSFVSFWTSAHARANAGWARVDFIPSRH